jgi:hypothetical protein
MTRGTWAYWLVLTAIALLATGWVTSYDPLALAGACVFLAATFWWIELRDRGGPYGEG